MSVTPYDAPSDPRHFTAHQPAKPTDKWGV